MEKNENGIVKELFQQDKLNVVSGLTGSGRTSLVKAFLNSLGPDFYFDIITNTGEEYEENEQTIVHKCPDDFVTEKQIQNILDDMFARKRLFIDHNYNKGKCPGQVYVFDGVFNDKWKKYLKTLANQGKVLKKLNMYVIIIEDAFGGDAGGLVVGKVTYNCVDDKCTNYITIMKLDKYLYRIGINKNIKMIHKDDGSVEVEEV